MEGYLGESEPVRVNDDPKSMALDWIRMYGGIDGSHHKDWVLDHVARILNGAPVYYTIASWENGHSERRYFVTENEQYHEWVRETMDGEDGPNTYNYDVGIAP